jgi:hypothetical protein
MKLLAFDSAFDVFEILHSGRAKRRLATRAVLFEGTRGIYLPAVPERANIVV